MIRELVQKVAVLGCTAQARPDRPCTHRRLRREVAIALAWKLLALIVLFLLFFSPSHRPDVSADAVETLFFAEPAQEAPPGLSTESGS